MEPVPEKSTPEVRMKTTTTIRSTIFRLLKYSRIVLITATTS